MNQTALDYYNLRSDPFSSDPCPQPYLGSAQRNALAAVYYHLEQGEKVPSLVGPSGVGRTTLLRLIEKNERAHRRTLLLSPTTSDVCGLLQDILSALGLGSVQQNATAMQTQLHDALARDVEVRGEVTLLIDDAQNLDDSGLNVIRLLLALPVSERKLVTLVLAGSTELQHRLSSPEFGDRLERVPLAALEPAEIEAYVNHRLRTAGWTGKSIFLADACAAISAHTNGVPKRVNEICSAALQLAAIDSIQQIDAAWLDGNANFAGAVTESAIRSEPVAIRFTATNTCVPLFTILVGTALFYIVRNQSGNLSAVSSKASVSVARAIDRKRRDPTSAGSLTTRILDTPGPAQAKAIQASSPQPTRPLPASVGKLPVTNQHIEDAVSALFHSPVLSSVPYKTRVHSVADSHDALERSDLAESAESASITIGNSEHLPHEFRPAAAGNATFRRDSGSAFRDSIGSPLLRTPYAPNESHWSPSIAAITNTERASDQITIGDAYMRLGDYGQALARYQNALATAPEIKPVQQKIREARAAEVTKESALINREKTSVAIRLGDAYLLRGDYDKAISSFEGALKFAPGSRELGEKLNRALRAKAAEDAVLR